MEASSVLRAMRAQKHDFLNQLQVILGYLQLNKPLEAEKYIEGIVFEINHLSKVTHLYWPEVALTFLVIRSEAAQKGIKIKYDIQTDLCGCALSGEEINWSLEKALAQVIFSLSPLQLPHRQIKIKLKEEPGYYACYINFYSKDNNPGWIEKQIRVINERLVPGKGRAEFVERNRRKIISLFFPKISSVK